MNKVALESLLRQTGKGLLTLGLSVVSTVLAIKACQQQTGDELARIHHFDLNGQKGVIVNKDSLWMKPKTTKKEE